MACPSNKVTSHRWQIDSFQKTYFANASTNGQISDSKFTLTTQSPASFALYFKFISGLLSSTFGVVLKEFGSKKSLEVGVKMWLENDAGQKLYENSVQKKIFAKVGDKYKVQTVNGEDYNSLYAVYHDRKALFVCCEITELNLPAPVVNTCTQVLKSLQKFHQNHWSAYEKEMHDAIIKVGSTEFKVFKFPFITQSDYFAQMFSSGFKEGITGEVEIKDIDEDTMKHLIRWLYTGQVEDESKAEELFKAAEKYNIEILKETCTELMMDTLSKDNAFARFTLSVIHNSGQLKNASLNLIAGMSDTEMAKFALSTEWMEFSRKNASVADEIAELVRQKLNI